jgi:hypothetical protein
VLLYNSRSGCGKSIPSRPAAGFVSRPRLRNDRSISSSHASALQNSARFGRFLFGASILKPILVVALLAVNGLFAGSSAQTETLVKDSLHTIAGDLKIVESKANCRYSVLLNDKVLLKTDCDNESSTYYATPEPTIHTYYKSLEGFGDFDEVVLLQMQMLGNACDGGDLIFLGLRKDGSHKLSNSIGFCGGRPPVITWGADRVTVFIPGGPPNRGKGYIPSETWIYEKGSVRRQVKRR